MANPVAAYRAENGIAQAGSYDPTVVAWIRQAAQATGADPSALLATALQESGAQRGRVGDNGTSFGPFQDHEGGALGSHPASWANTYGAVLDRAQQFARLDVHGGVGAAAVQRPANQTLYAQGVNSLLSRASAILGTPLGATPATPTAVSAREPGSLSYNPTNTLNFVNALLDGASADRLAMLGSRLTHAGTSSAPAASPSPLPSAAGAGTSPPAKVGGDYKVGNFEGTKVAAWMVPALNYARANGWQGKLTSGLRSTQLQALLYKRYQNGGNIAAKPGQSNHEIQNGGAFDATDASQLNSILKNFKGQRPIWAPTVGLNDSVHFSVNGH